MNRAGVLADIALLSEELCDPRVHHEPYYTVDKWRHKKLTHVYTTTQPGLLAQLAEAIQNVVGEQTEAVGRPVFESKPPLALEALSRYAAIQIGVIRLCWSVRLDVSKRDTLESKIYGLVGMAPTLDDETVAFLRDEMRSWRIQCAVMTGWASGLWCPWIACPQCTQVGKLRINLSKRVAMCSAGNCGAVWDQENDGIYKLADWVRETVAVAC